MHKYLKKQIVLTSCPAVIWIHLQCLIRFVLINNTSVIIIMAVYAISVIISMTINAISAIIMMVIDATSQIIRLLVGCISVFIIPVTSDISMIIIIVDSLLDNSLSTHGKVVRTVIPSSPNQVRICRREGGVASSPPLERVCCT